MSCHCENNFTDCTVSKNVCRRQIRTRTPVSFTITSNTLICTAHITSGAFYLNILWNKSHVNLNILLQLHGVHPSLCVRRWIHMMTATLKEWDSSAVLLSRRSRQSASLAAAFASAGTQSTCHLHNVVHFVLSDIQNIVDCNWIQSPQST